MTQPPQIAARCHGIDVPDSPLLTPSRIERINAAQYEGQEIAGALAVLRPGDRVLELGAGLGLVGAIAAGSGKPARVVSFEANPDLIPHIRALYALNGLQDRIEVRNEVLISAPEAPDTVTFHLRNSYLGSSLIDTDSRATRPVEVPTARYGALLAELSPTVMLIDIEGGELDFLRHATLTGVRAIVIEFHPDAYGIEGMRACKALLEKAGFVKRATHSTRLVWTCTRDDSLQPPAPDAGWSTDSQIIEGAVVVPPVEQGFVQAAGVLHPDGAYCASGALWRNGRALTTRPPMPRGTLTERKGTWLWGGVLWMHFGHFLVESTARLWALHELGERIEGVLFIPKRPRNLGEVAEFQRSFVRLMGTQVEVVSTSGPERVERLIVPGQGFGLGKMIEGTQSYRTAIAARFASEIAAGGSERLYISRSQLPTGRGNLIGEAALEAHLARQGYTVYHPEKHDLTAQIATYKAAKQVIAAEGSALHLLAMVARPDQQVAIVVRRPSGATRQLEKHLQRFAGIDPLMISRLARSWKPLGAAKSRLWMGELDMPALQEALAESGFIARDAAPWPALAPEEVQAQLGDRFEIVHQSG